MIQKARPDLNKKLILYGIFLIIIALSVFFALTINKKSVSILMHIQFKYFVVLLFLWVLYILFDAIKFHLLSCVESRGVSILVSFKTIAIGIFLAAITPFQVSGLPVQIYYLTRFGVGAGEATSYLLLRGMVTFAGILVLGLPFSYIFRGTFVGVMKGIYLYALFVLSFIAGLYIIVIFLPGISKKVIKGKTYDEFMALRKVLLGALKDRRGRIYILAAFLSTLVSLVFLGLIPYFVQRAVGMKVFSFKASIGYEMIAVSSLLFTPTPGGSGLAEAAGSFIFLRNAGKEFIFPFVVLWRFFTFYITSLFGALVFLIESKRMLK